MKRDEKLETINLMEEKERRSKGRKINSYYPDTGPLRRELYVKHMHFFEAGLSFRERLMMAANRIGKCVSGDTLIESPYGPSQKVKDIRGDHWVWAWDGEKKVPAKAQEPFTKPSEMIYRVWLESGQFVDCAAEHRFLGEAGWLFLSDLFGCVPRLPQSIEGISLPESLEDARRLMNKLPNSQVDCHQRHHSGDVQLLCDLKISQAFSPLLVDVLKRIRSLSRWDALAYRCRDILLRIVDRLSIRCVAHHSSGRSFEFLGEAVGSVELSCRDLFPESSQHLLESSDQFQLGAEVFLRPNLCAPPLLSPEGLSNRVVCYQPISIQPIYDFHVPVYLNYCTAGLIHHNTEGVGGFEMTLHLTGQYPSWWVGKRFTKPIDAWAAGDTAKTVREIIQFKLLGPLHEMGTGLIPKDLIVRTTNKQGVADAIDTIYVRHVSGGVSHLVLKSYDQKRHSFQGTEKDVIWLDEEPDLDIYTECLLRTMTNDGIIMLTFTPLLGMSETVMSFLPGGQIAEKQGGSKFIVMATWEDAPHLSQAAKDELWNSIPPFQRDARSKGVPQLGAGAIYPVPESDIVVNDFPIPDHWPRAYGMDVGWNRTAVPWGAWDLDTDTLYLYAEHYRGQSEPSIHAQAIKAKGDWIPGVIDPASRGRSQRDGFQLLETYQELGLDVDVAFNGVESGIYEVWQRLSTGRLKVFKSMSNWLFEYRIYRRDEKGHIVKAHDHLMDAMRYLVMSGLERAKTKPKEVVNEARQFSQGSSATGWMG